MKAKGLLKRVNWLRVAGLTLGSGVAMAFGLPSVGLIGAGVSAVNDMTDGDVTTNDITAAEKAGKDLATAGAGLVNPQRGRRRRRRLRPCESTSARPSRSWTRLWWS